MISLEWSQVRKFEIFPGCKTGSGETIWEAIIVILEMMVTWTRVKKSKCVENWLDLYFIQKIQLVYRFGQGLEKDIKV